jgi:hypothetical protein
VSGSEKGRRTMSGMDMFVVALAVAVGVFVIQVVRVWWR